MEYQKITNLLGNAFVKVPRFITKKWIEVHDQSGITENRYNSNKQITFKTSMLRSDICDYSDACIVVKRKIIAANPDTDAHDKKLVLKIMRHLLAAFQKLITHLLIMQKIWML